MPNDPIDILAIGASTGGIHALGALSMRLPQADRRSDPLTQHLPAPFMTVFARQLGAVAQREALVAENGMALVPDRIIVAPGDAHLTLDRGEGGRSSGSPMAAASAAACRRSIRCSRRSARSTAPARSASS